MKDIIEIDGKKYFVLFTYVDDDYKYIFYTDNTYNEYKMLNVIFGTYEIINDNYIVKEITEELRKKKAVAIFNLEMSAEQLVNRMISALGGVENKKLTNGQLGQNDWKKYNEAVSQLADTNIYIEDNSGITVNDIRAKCRRLATKKEGLGLIIIDYLQLLTMGGRRPESRQQEVSDISRSIKMMAMELKVPVIALAQLSRNAEKRENNEPMLADLRESGSIEQDADIVMFINRKDYYKAKTELGKSENVETDIIIAKHRKGGTGKFTVLFEPSMMNFKNYMVLEKEGDY